MERGQLRPLVKPGQAQTLAGACEPHQQQTLALLAAEQSMLPPWDEATLMQLVGSGFLFWSALPVARDPVIKRLLATRPELPAQANPQQRSRVDAMLANILPLSLRAQGLRGDTAMGKRQQPAPLASTG